MNVYRLNPIDPGHASWQYSVEKNTVWTCAPTPKEARDQVASRTGFAAYEKLGGMSPWQDARITSCALEPTMTYPSPGEVVREDGSVVDY